MDARTTVIIQDIAQLQAGIRTVKALVERGHHVRVLLLFKDSLGDGPDPVSAGLDPKAVEWLSTAPSHGIRLATIEAMAQLMREVDFVVPF